MPRYALPGRNPGLLIRGNIDIDNRPPVKYRGGIATVRSITVPTEVDGRKAYLLLPTVVGKRVVSSRAAVDEFRRSGKHLGVFRTAKQADEYGIRLHLYHAKRYGGG